MGNRRYSWLAGQLQSMGLRPVYKEGMQQFGESVIIGVADVVRNKFFTDVTFMDQPLESGVREFTMRFNSQLYGYDGAVVFVELNGDHCLIVRQWRKCGRWTHEVPRGFALEAGVGERSLEVLRKDIGGRAMDLLHVKQVTEFGEIDENTGTSNISPLFSFVQAEANLETLERCYAKNSPIKIEVWSYDRLWVEIGGKLRDLHSIVAACLVRKHLNSM